MRKFFAPSSPVGDGDGVPDVPPNKTSRHPSNECMQFRRDIKFRNPPSRGTTQDYSDITVISRATPFQKWASVQILCLVLLLVIRIINQTANQNKKQKESDKMPIISAYIVPHPPLIVPEVGKGQEKTVQKTVDSYHIIAKKISEIKPQTIIVISPHSVMYADYIHVSPGKNAQGSLKRFGAPEVYKTDYDVQLADEICRLCDSMDFPAGSMGEKDASLDHGTLVPLYFINKYYTDYQLIRCSISGLSRQEHYRFGMILSEAVENLNRKCVIVASGDLSHKLSDSGPYGFAPEGPELDKKLTDIMQSSDFGEFLRLDPNLCGKGAECGLGSFVIMSGALDKKSVAAQFYSYEGTTGVGYAVCGYNVKGDDPNRDFLTQNLSESDKNIQNLRGAEDAFVRLARETLESYVISGKKPNLPDNLPDNLRERAGVFVSIKKNGQLRGCIGTIEPTQPTIAQEIMANAVSSGTRDPRFSPVRKDELPDLVYSVDVLFPAEPIKNEDKNLLDVMRYGVIVTSGHKRGLLLPNLEGVDTVDEQLSIACQKAGIGKNEKYQIERFEVIRHT